MSAIGPGNIGALNLAGSAAGAQRAEADTNQNRADAAGRKFQIDQKKLSSQSLDDVAETELSSERDPDGRLPYERNHSEQSERDNSDAKEKSDRAPDAFGDRGNSLDLEA